MLAFVITHLSAHSLLLISLPFAQDALVRLMQPWRSGAGTLLLVTAFVVHYANALWSIYERRSLRLTRWQWAQLGFGLCIPLLLALHVASTRLAEAFLIQRARVHRVVRRREVCRHSIGRHEVRRTTRARDGMLASAGGPAILGAG